MFKVWEAVRNRMPSGTVFLCMLLSVMIPYAVYKINTYFHKIGDAPWKKQQNKAVEGKQHSAGQKPAE